MSRAAKVLEFARVKELAPVLSAKDFEKGKIGIGDLISVVENVLDVLENRKVIDLARSKDTEGVLGLRFKEASIFLKKARISLGSAQKRSYDIQLS